ncbi:unnamed protein product [Meganyctiphanes norvegica]|uniref:Uncharacterized protein n=1 Tax=Meganyctiphanes norvegica TaxID=48144 RepID=A0AAV2QMS5_MEGNR
MQASNQQKPSPSGPRKRKINIENWQRIVAKKALNSGKQYVSMHTGKTIPARKIGNPCTCKKRCFATVGEESITAIYTNFWASGDHNPQTAFIQIHVTEKPVVPHYTDNMTRIRKFMRQYWLKVGDNVVEVCKEAFGSILGISPSRIFRAVLKMTASGLIIPDMRGKHMNHRQVSQDKLQLAKDHIDSFSTVTSHCSKNNSPNVRYLEAGVKSKAHMYRLYQKWLHAHHPDMEPITQHCYDDLLTREYPNLKLSKSRSDTCKTSDRLNIQLKDDTVKVKVEPGIIYSNEDKGESTVNEVIIAGLGQDVEMVKEEIEIKEEQLYFQQAKLNIKDEIEIFEEHIHVNPS